MFLGDLLSTIEQLDLEAEAVKALSATSDRMEERNREQLTEGLTSEGKRLKPYRRPRYARVKNEMNPRPGLWNPDFKVKGDFYAGIRVEVTTAGVHTYSTDPNQGKVEFLEQRDGADNIYGLSAPEHNAFVEEDLQPVWIEQMEAACGLPFSK